MKPKQERLREREKSRLDQLRKKVEARRKDGWRDPFAGFPAKDREALGAAARNDEGIDPETMGLMRTMGIPPSPAYAGILATQTGETSMQINAFAGGQFNVKAFRADATKDELSAAWGRDRRLREEFFEFEDFAALVRFEGSGDPDGPDLDAPHIHFNAMNYQANAPEADLRAAFNRPGIGSQFFEFEDFLALVRFEGRR